MSLALGADMAAAQECVAEGGSVAVVPNAPQCCEGLALISCNRPVDGVCPDRPCLGAQVCAACGDGTCGGGENECNCAADCGDTGSNIGTEEAGTEEGGGEEGVEEGGTVEEEGGAVEGEQQEIGGDESGGEDDEEE